jgi:hypothetical protein
MAKLKQNTSVDLLKSKKDALLKAPKKEAANARTIKETKKGRGRGRRPKRISTEELRRTTPKPKFPSLQQTTNRVGVSGGNSKKT